MKNTATALQIRSLGFKTEMIFHRFDGTVLDRGSYVVVKTPSNPGFIYGNFLLFFEAPHAGSLAKWKELFQKEFADTPLVRHLTFLWDAGGKGSGEVSEFRSAGFKVDFSVVLTAKAVHRSEKFNSQLEIRSTVIPSEWRAVIENQILGKSADFDPVKYRQFKERQFARYQAMTAAGLGHWFGAYLDGKLVGDLGIYHDDSLGRFQSVETHPDFRRRGVCSTLVYESAEFAFKKMGITQLVMVADEHYHAAKIYESVGFQPAAKEYSGFLDGTREMKARLLELIAAQPREPVVFDLSKYEVAIENTVAYLNSSAALHAIDLNPYWPKWNSPWWHMSALFEMGLVDRIPEKTARYHLAALKRTQLPYFFEQETPSDKKSDQEAPCFCGLGKIYQILNARGLEVDESLPWARDWFLKYQMKDGGLSCDDQAYEKDSTASSLVATIGALEAVLSAKNLSSREIDFLEKGAHCILARKLRLGSSHRLNLEERDDEEDWLKPCFPRFYFYDVLRGLHFLVRWSETLNRPLAANLILPVVEHLCQSFPEGKIKAKRFCFQDVHSRAIIGPGKTGPREATTHFQLLDEISTLNIDSYFLTAQWRQVVDQLGRLAEKGLLT